MDILDYAISEVLSQLTLDNLVQSYPVTFVFFKIIPAEIRYETGDIELLAIIKAFKTW